MEVKKVIQYEVETNLAVLKKTSTWLNVSAIVALILVIFEQYLLTILCLLVMIVLKISLDSKSGEVIAYYREKQGIPNATKIREIKNRANI